MRPPVSPTPTQAHTHTSHAPLFAQDPPHPPILLFLFIAHLGGKRLRSRRKHARPAARLKICKSFVRPFRLQHHGSVPAGIDKEAIRVRNLNTQCARTGLHLSLVWRNGRADRKRRVVYPTNHVVQCPVRTVPTRVSKQTFNPNSHKHSRLRSCSVLQQLQVGRNLASPWTYVNVDDRIAVGIVRSRTTDTNDAMEVRRRERQAVEIGRHFAHSGISVIQILHRLCVIPCFTNQIRGDPPQDSSRPTSVGQGCPRPQRLHPTQCHPLEEA